jgi:hypothetical protein
MYQSGFCYTFYPVLYISEAITLAIGCAFEVHFVTIQHPSDVNLYFQCLCFHPTKDNDTSSRTMTLKINHYQYYGYKSANVQHFPNTA